MSLPITRDSRFRRPPYVRVSVVPRLSAATPSPSAVRRCRFNPAAGAPYTAYYCTRSKSIGDDVEGVKRNSTLYAHPQTYHLWPPPRTTLCRFHASRPVPLYLPFGALDGFFSTLCNINDAHTLLIVAQMLGSHDAKLLCSLPTAFFLLLFSRR